MAALEYAELVLQAHIDGQTRTGTFQFPAGEQGKAKIDDKVRTGYLIGGRGSTINAIIQSLVSDGEPLRKGIHLDLGGGQHAFQFEFTVREGIKMPNGSDFQWGSSSNPNDGPNAHTATGADPRDQAAVLMNYIRVGQTDSRTSGTFRWWQYHSGGFLGEMDVAVESPNVTATAGDPGVDGSMTLVETLSLSDAGDATKRRSR